MALTEEGAGGIPATMLVGPANFAGQNMPYPIYMNGQGGNSNGNGWDNGWWIILLFILLASGNWGNQNNGGGGGMFGGAPIVVNDGNGGSVQRGFDQAAVMNGIGDITGAICNGFSNVQQSLCNGFAGVNAGVSNGFAQAEIANNARQMANMNQIYGLSSQFADCCCENRLATADLKSTVLSENCADRYEAAQNTRDIIDSQTRGTQVILDKLCQLELDGVRAQVEAKNDRIGDLERQLTMANLAASQTRQTTDIQNSIINELRSCPIPSQPVYGSQPIFTCPNNNNGCGCGCNGGF